MPDVSHIVYEDGTPHEGFPWATEEVICVKCGHYWIATHPCLEYLQCMICRSLTPSVADLTQLP